MTFTERLTWENSLGKYKLKEKNYKGWWAPWPPVVELDFKKATPEQKAIFEQENNHYPRRVKNARSK